MAKIKKFDRVTTYLKKLKNDKKISDDDLMKLHFRDLMDLPEMKGIGDRTISNALKAFKKEFGVLPKKEIISKRQKVRNYLDEQMRSGKMTVDELLDIRFQDLMGREPLKGIGKTTISCTLSIYKKNYEKNIFENNILNFIDKERAADQSPEETDAEHAIGIEAAQKAETAVRLSNTEISILRQMMDQYHENMFNLAEQKDRELQELKLALDFSGIDGQRILELYWKSRKEVVIPMNRLIPKQNRDLYSLQRA